MKKNDLFKALDDFDVDRNDQIVKAKEIVKS